MRVLIACDKFKGSLSALKVSNAIVEGIKLQEVETICDVQELADGGDGTMTLLQNHLDLKAIYQNTIDPLGRSIQSKYMSDGNRAIVELAEASGIARLHKNELDVMHCNTLGTGDLIKHALENGHKKIVLTLGGSCTQDMGLGIAYSLGFRFYDLEDESLIPSGSTLGKIKRIEGPKEEVNLDLTILVDVDNPLYGPKGAAHVYAKQKGASKTDIDILEESCIQLSKLIENYSEKNIGRLKGGGAAGGIAAGLSGFFDEVKVISGFDYLSELLGLEKKIKDADLLISGEGKFDHQSLDGKVVGKMLELAKANKKPLIVVCGISDLSAKETKNLGIEELYTLISIADSPEQSMNESEKLLQIIGQNINL